MEETTIPSTDTSSEKNKRIAKNTLMLYFRMILTMLVSLYTSRVILNILGVEDYGIYNVVGGVVTMFAFFNSAMSSATQRFLSFEIGKGDFVQLKKTFNATQIIHIGIAILIFILAETVGLWFVKTYLVIPPERMGAALWVYHLSVLSFTVSVIQVPYNATIIAHERMNVYAYVSILEVLLKLLIVFMLTWITYDKLKLYGILHFGVVFIIAAIYRIYTRRNFGETALVIVKDKILFKELFSFSSWSLFGGLANVGSKQGTALIMNLFLGVNVNAALGISNQVFSALYQFVSNFQTAFRPQIVKSFAANKIYEHRILLFRSSRYSYYILLILIVPIFINMEYILILWLKNVPEYTVKFTQIMLIIALIESLAGPFWMSINSTGKIKKYQILISLLLLLNLPITYFLLKNNYAPVTVMLFSLIINSLALIIRIIFVKCLIGFDLKNLIDYILKIITTGFMVFVPLYFLKKNVFLQDNIINLICFSLLSVLYSILQIFIIGTDKKEKRVFIQVGKRILQKIKFKKEGSK